ncbi:cytochrome c-550 [Synechococcus sp. BIOS-E4-1]|uniref:photosystem II cytochrome c-550 n=1 Tax=unclassified Synechococcus TaxID=2626047 RepID=UPI0007BC0C50|nr:MULTISPECIES: photosystem II cytochrome c-550 [unclassified Synechococcus]KZR85451.1 Cytochrome c-550 precursor [Synechococcus sp. MIT S9504]KZR89464.1 Cytochrome c-550 precursor [Synechococcus sp. MIT S9509]QNI56057.1 cytochrome c-550 [Synechococcus sp. BIOS-E4-1]
MVPLLFNLRKSLIRLLIVLPVLAVLSISSPVHAALWDTETLTVPSDPEGTAVTFSEQQVKAGRKVFNTSCGTCHAGGITKTNHNVGLDPETLALATPSRDNIAALVDYMQDPTSYDGEYSIADLHPSMRSRDLYPAMRDLTDEDLQLMSAYILVAPKVLGQEWGGGKIYF